MEATHTTKFRKKTEAIFAIAFSGAAYGLDAGHRREAELNSTPTHPAFDQPCDPIKGLDETDGSGSRWNCISVGNILGARYVACEENGRMYSSPMN